MSVKEKAEDCEYGKGQEFDVRLSSQEIYWLVVLLKEFIEEEANIEQITDTLPLYHKFKALSEVGI